jgi:hypothetical protein
MFELIEDEPQPPQEGRRHGELWATIDEYVVACGGDILRTTGWNRRVNAVVAVDRVLQTEDKQNALVMAAMREALHAVKLRIALIGDLHEPGMGMPWPQVSHPDWSQEIALIDRGLTFAEGGAAC